VELSLFGAGRGEAGAGAGRCHFGKAIVQGAIHGW